MKDMESGRDKICVIENQRPAEPAQLVLTGGTNMDYSVYAPVDRKLLQIIRVGLRKIFSLFIFLLQISLRKKYQSMLNIRDEIIRFNPLIC